MSEARQCGLWGQFEKAGFVRFRDVERIGAGGYLRGHEDYLGLATRRCRPSHWSFLGRSRCPFLLDYLERPPTTRRAWPPWLTTSDRPSIAELGACWVERRDQCRGRRAPPTIGRTSPPAAARATPHPGPSWLPAFPPSRSSGFSPSSTSPRPGSGCPWRPCTRASPSCGRRQESRSSPCCSSATGSGRASP